MKKNIIILAIVLLLLFGAGALLWYFNQPPATTGKPADGNSTKKPSTGGGKIVSDLEEVLNPGTKAAVATTAAAATNKTPGAYANSDLTTIYTASPFGQFALAKKDDWLGTVTDEWATNPLYWLLDSGHVVLKSAVYLVS